MNKFGKKQGNGPYDKNFNTIKKFSGGFDTTCTPEKIERGKLKKRIAELEYEKELKLICSDDFGS